MTDLYINTLKDILSLYRPNHSGQYIWQYPITKNFEEKYSSENARSLFEFAYLVLVHNTEIANDHPDPIKLDPPNFNIAIPLDTKIFHNDLNILWFFYSTNLNIAVLAFTGTYNTQLSLINLNYFQVNPLTIGNHSKDMKVHGGFWMLYQGIQTQLHKILATYVNKDTQILITGFSLGGATSSIATLDLHERILDTNVELRNIIHYSFASPRTFNIQGAQYYNFLMITSYRIFNGSDIIPLVPFPIMPNDDYFLHVGKLHHFEINLKSYVYNHVDAYLQKYHLTSIC